MSVILLMLGIVLAAAGVGLIGFGIPINELSRGATLILSGSFAFVGGLLMVGLAAVVAGQARIVALLRARPAIPATPAMTTPAVMTVAAPGPPAETVARENSPVEEPLAEPTPNPTVEVSATAIDRLRSSIPRSDKAVPEAEEVPLSPNGQQVPQAEPRIEPLPRFEPQPRSAGAAAVEAREPRLDFLLRSRQGRSAPQGQESFDAVWPKRPGRDGQSDPRLEVARASGVPGPSSASALTAPPPSPAVEEEEELAPPPAPPAPVDEVRQAERPVAILKSGVVDGMAYTLYADGSIEAQLPQGTVRFGSIAELRAHIESNS